MIRLSTTSICFFLILTFGLNGQTDKSTENYPGNIQLKSGTDSGLTLDAGIPGTISNFFTTTPSTITLKDGAVTRISMQADRLSGGLNPIINAPLITLTGDVPGSSKTFMTFKNDSGTPFDTWNFNISSPAQGNGSIFEFVYQVDGGNPITPVTISSSGLSNSSDRRLKTNINTIKSALPSLMRLNATHYNRKINLKQREYGFIAQEVEKIYPDMVSVVTKEDGEGQYMMNYTQLIPILTKGMQEQQGLINQQNILIKDLQKRMEALEKAN